jgi:hypothetical protein
MHRHNCIKDIIQSAIDFLVLRRRVVQGQPSAAGVRAGGVPVRAGNVRGRRRHQRRGRVPGGGDHQRAPVQGPPVRPRRRRRRNAHRVRPQPQEHQGSSSAAWATVTHHELI